MTRRLEATIMSVCDVCVVDVHCIVTAITVCPYNDPVAASSQEAQGEGCPSSTSDGAQGSQGCS